MAESSPKLKRKRNADTDVAVVLGSQDPGTLHPVLASFPAVAPSMSTSFQLYGSKYNPSRSILVGEADRIEYESTNQSGLDGEGGEGYSCQYVLAVRNKRTRTVTMAPVPLHLLSTKVKALKNLPPIQSSDPTVPGTNAAARAVLGTAFGTKRAQRSIRAAERNAIDPNSMASEVKSFLEDSITGATAQLPSPEKVKQEADEKRPVPTPNVDAATPGEVYDLDEILPPREYKSINTKPFTTASTMDDRVSALPYQDSAFVNQRLVALFGGLDNGEEGGKEIGKKETKTLRRLVFLSYLLAFRSTKFGGKGKLAKSLGGHTPQSILDGLIDRFTEVPRGSNSPVMTPFTELKLLSHILVLCLALDSWSVDVSSLATELHLAPQKLNEAFKSLGCKIRPPTAAELSRMIANAEATGSSVADARNSKRAVLTVPFEFPKAKRGPAKR